MDQPPKVPGEAPATPQQPSSPTSDSSSSRSSAPLFTSHQSCDIEASRDTEAQERSFITPIKHAFQAIYKQPESKSITKVPPDIRAIDEYEVGYGRLAAVEDCDPNFLICRKFGWLHCRLLLHLQDELQRLERQLERLDKRDARNGNQLVLESYRDDCARPYSARASLLTEIKSKLAEYDELMLRLQKIQALKRPSDRNHGSLYRMVRENIVYEEGKWAHRTDDLAAVARDAEHGWFNVSLEHILNILSRRTLLTIFRTSEQRIKTGNISYINLVSPKRFDVLLRGTLTFLAAILLLIPVLILFEMQPDEPTRYKRMAQYQVLVVFLFTLAFSICFTTVTNARRQEVFAGTAAYCGVLVIFLGNTSQVIMSSNTK